MSVSTTLAIEVFDGNNSTSIPYPISIVYDSDEDLYLRVGGVASSDFTVSEDGFRTGVAIAPGTDLVLYRVTPRTQVNPFPSNTTPAPEDVAAALDKLTLICQELSGNPQPGAKSLTFQIDEPSNFNTQLPLPIERLDTFVYFDEDTGEMTLLTRTQLVTLLGEGFRGEPGEPGEQGDEGEDGLSAYGVAVAAGFVGDEAAWLESLVGDDGVGFTAGTTVGDIKYWNGSIWANLPPPTVNPLYTHILSHNGIVPYWVAQAVIPPPPVCNLCGSMSISLTGGSIFDGVYTLTKIPSLSAYSISNPNGNITGIVLEWFSMTASWGWTLVPSFGPDFGADFLDGSEFCVPPDGSVTSSSGVTFTIVNNCTS